MTNLKHLTLVSVLIVGSCLSAQENVGTIIGTVRGPNGNPIAGATISLSGANLLGSRPVQTDAQGNYRIQLLLPGQYTVRVSMQGFISGTAVVNLTGGSTIRADLNLRAVGVQEEVVEIVGTENPMIDKTETKVASTYTATDLSNLPTGSVGVYAAQFLAPGVSGDSGYARMRGGMAGQSQYMINGMVARDPAVGQGRQYELMLEDLIADVQVIQNPINAKYGFTNTGIIAVSTKTGTNQFQGSLRLRLDNAAWRTYNTWPTYNRWGEQEQGSLISEGMTYIGNNTVSNDQIGRTYEITLSGPIIKDRLTFTYGTALNPVQAGSMNRYLLLNSGSGNPLNNYTYLPSMLSTDPRYQGPDPTNNNQMADNWAVYYWGGNPQLPTEPMPIRVKSSNNIFSYRLYWQVTPNHQIDFNYTNNPYTSGPDTGNITSAFLTEPGEEISIQQSSNRINRNLGYKGIIGSSGVLTASYGSTNSIGRFATGPDDTLYLWHWTSSAVGLADNAGRAGTIWTGGNWGTREYNRQNKTYALDYNHIWDNHNIDVGVQMLEEMNRNSSRGTRGLNFYSMGRRYDGTYLVYNALDQGGPLWTGEGIRNWYSANLETHRNYFFNNNRVPTMNDTNPYGLSGDQVKGTTTVVYVNDNWTINDRWAVNLGVRIPNSKLEDATGERVNVTSFEPRFRIQHDLYGDNKHIFAFSATQKAGTIAPFSLGTAYSVSENSQTRTYLWNVDNPNNPAEPWREYFVDYATLKNVDNYGYYWRYSDTAQSYQIDPNLKPQLTTEFEFYYRRAFDRGGFFRISGIYNFLSNAWISRVMDEELELVDPTGAQPASGIPVTYRRFLENDSTRGRHYASAEMEWMMPLISKESYRLSWHGNWTIAKTTGNTIFNASNSTASGEVSTLRPWDNMDALEIPKDLYDPWGEMNTPRHNMKTWFTLTHGTRGGITNTVTLFAYYESGVPNVYTTSFVFPTGTFYNASSSGNGGRVTDFPTSFDLFPYGRGYRRDRDIWYADLQWNVNIPLKGRLSLWAEISIGNPFNQVYNTNVMTNWWNPLTYPTWVKGQSTDDIKMWGKRYAWRNTGSIWGTDAGTAVVANGSGASTNSTSSYYQGNRQFNVQFDVGLRF